MDFERARAVLETVDGEQEANEAFWSLTPFGKPTPPPSDDEPLGWPEPLQWDEHVLR